MEMLLLEAAVGALVNFRFWSRHGSRMQEDHWWTLHSGAAMGGHSETRTSKLCILH